MFPAASPTSGSCRIFRKPLKGSCTPCEHPSLAVERSDVKVLFLLLLGSMGAGALTSVQAAQSSGYWISHAQQQPLTANSSSPGASQEWYGAPLSGAGVGLLSEWGSTDFSTAPLSYTPCGGGSSGLQHSSAQ